MARPKRIPNFAYRGPLRYFLTICTRDRIPYLACPDNCRCVIRQFVETAMLTRMSITVYCAMPDHLHLLVKGIAIESDLRAFVTTAKQCSGWEFRQRTYGRLWQDGYYERVLREHETDWNVARYIVNNPVRAGLARHPLDYAFWGSQVYTREQVLEYVASCQEEDVGRPW